MAKNELAPESFYGPHDLYRYWLFCVPPCPPYSFGLVFGLQVVEREVGDRVVKKYDNGLGLIYAHLDARYKMATKLRDEDEARIEYEFRKGVLEREDLQELSDQADAMDELALEYLERAMSVWSTATRRRSYVRCRTRRPVPPVIETPTGRPAVAHSTEVRPLSPLDAFSLLESGPHGPPCLVGGPP